ncbi:MAG: molybdenum cofactor biosynthesis protein MoaE [Dermatophilaceae bacterium]
MSAADPAAGAALVLADIRTAALSVDEVHAAVRDRRAGAVVLFVGAVRDADHGKPVQLLEYTCHPSARDAAARLVERHAQSAGVVRVGVLHRVGRLAVGDLAVVAGVAAGHRAEAFDVCRALVDEFKATVPVWKHQVFADGTDEWVGVR